MLVLELTKLHATMGHQSAVVSMFPTENAFNPQVEEQRLLGISWFTPKLKLNRFDRLKHLRRVQQDFSPNVTFAHSVLPAAYMRISGVGAIIPVLHAEDNYSSINLILSEYALQFFSKGVITVSPRAQVLYGERFKFPKLKCIPNGIELDKYSNAKLQDRANLLTSLGLPEHAVIALQVGRITAIKQQNLSVRAMAPLIAENPRIHLLLAGIYEDTAALSDLRNEIQGHNLVKNVHLIGPRDDIPTLLQLASVYLMPSKQEAHSVALIEAMASGVEIVASDIPAFKYVKHLKGITLTDPNAVESFGFAIKNAISSEQRFKHKLLDFDIKLTAASYIEFAKSCI
jgi:glycosyltransferase involved in cell wall biosynthesis